MQRIMCYQIMIRYQIMTLSNNDVLSNNDTVSNNDVIQSIYQTSKTKKMIQLEYLNYIYEK